MLEYITVSRWSCNTSWCLYANKVLVYKGKINTQIDWNILDQNQLARVCPYMNSLLFSVNVVSKEMMTSLHPQTTSAAQRLHGSMRIVRGTSTFQPPILVCSSSKVCREMVSRSCLLGSYWTTVSYFKKRIKQKRQTEKGWIEIKIHLVIKYNSWLKITALPINTIWDE